MPKRKTPTVQGLDPAQLVPSSEVRALADHLATTKPKREAADKATLTLGDLAELLGVSKGTAARWAKIGTIPGPLPGTKRWSRAAVLERLSGKVAQVEEESPYDKWVRERDEAARRK